MITRVSVYNQSPEKPIANQYSASNTKLTSTEKSDATENLKGTLEPSSNTHEKPQGLIQSNSVETLSHRRVEIDEIEENDTINTANFNSLNSSVQNAGRAPQSKRTTVSHSNLDAQDSQIIGEDSYHDTQRDTIHHQNYTIKFLPNGSIFVGTSDQKPNRVPVKADPINIQNTYSAHQYPNYYDYRPQKTQSLSSQINYQSTEISPQKTNLTPEPRNSTDNLREFTSDHIATSENLNSSLREPDWIGAYRRLSEHIGSYKSYCSSAYLDSDLTKHDPPSTEPVIAKNVMRNLFGTESSNSKQQLESNNSKEFCKNTKSGTLLKLIQVTVPDVTKVLNASPKAISNYRIDRSLLNAQYEYIKQKTRSPVRMSHSDKSVDEFHSPSLEYINHTRKGSHPVVVDRTESLHQYGLPDHPILQSRGSLALKKDATGTADQSLRCVAIEKHHSNVKKQPSTTNLVEENIRAIERSFLLQQKAKDEEIGDSESVHCLYIEKEQLETISRHKRYHSSVEFSSSEKAAGSQSLRSPIKQPKTYEQVCEDYPDGSRYEGEKYLGKRHGKGTYYYKQGYVYEGHWEADLMEGFGVLWAGKDRKMYEGDWHRGKFHGRGTLVNCAQQMVCEEFDGTNFELLRSGWLMYEGNFKEGKKTGFGVVTISNGDKYVGHFVEDTVDGEGSYSRLNGRTIVGKWKKNKLVSQF